MVLPLIGGSVVRGMVVIGPIVPGGPDPGLVVVVLDVDDDPGAFVGKVVVDDPEDDPSLVVDVCGGLESL